jgi:peptide/nickel transport system permease protein
MARKDKSASAGLKYVITFFRERPLSMFGAFIVLIYVLLIFFGTAIAPYNPESSTADYLEPPSSEHWLGTDRAGLDIFSRIISAPRIDLTIGIVATSIAALIGVPLGIVSGYVHGWGGSMISRSFDVLQCLPPFVVAMSLVAFGGQSITNVIIVLALLNSPLFVRLVRSKVYSVQERKFIEAAVCLGNSRTRIMLRHLLPNSLEPVLIQFPVNVGWAILMTAGLSFVGAGVRPPTPEWGSMIAIGAPLLATGHWWVGLFPGIAVGICVFGLALVANALEVLLDPTRR